MSIEEKVEEHYKKILEWSRIRNVWLRRKNQGNRVL